MITAAHCVCDDPSKKDRTHCAPKDENQIKPMENEVTMYGGSTSVENFAFQSQWDADAAYIMSDPLTPLKPSSSGWLREDIAIAMLSFAGGKRFFDKNILKFHFEKKEDELAKVGVVPICMVAKRKDFKRKILKKKRVFRGLGWGTQYSELNPPKAKKNYSSCMTSPGSPLHSRYQNCELKEIKTNNWRCNTADDHPGFDQRCNDYMNQFEKNKPALQSNWIWADFEDIDIVYIKDGYPEPTKCYSPFLIKERGWCYTGRQHFDPRMSISQAWGTCSLSCSDQLKAVYL